MLLEGMHLPLTTPFFPDGRLNLRKLEQNVAHYSLTPAAGLVVLGSTGEANLLSDVETREVLQAAMGAAAETKVMLAGVSRDSVRGALDLIEAAAELRYDAVLVRGPEFTGLGLAEARLYLQAVADRSALPVVLAGDVPLEMLSEFAAHSRVIGCLRHFAEAEQIRLLLARTSGVRRTVTVTAVFAAVTGRMLVERATEGFVSAASLTGGLAVAVTLTKPGIKTRTKVVGFQVLVGRTERMLEGLVAGAVGAVPPFAAAAPQGCYEVMAAWKDGDPALAEEKQLRLVAAARRIEGELGVAGLKYGCDLNGYVGGVPRLPLMPLTGAERVEVEGLMAGLKS